jgi:NAD(P)-dependent dehydrogenase (short-subunit alcohol dehydrogenase family)
MSKKVCVITGGGGGMGFATARVMGQDMKVVIVGRTEPKLGRAVKQLELEGINVQSFVCDIADEESVKRLASFAKEAGIVASVIHAAGLSPHMGNARQIMEANALGTINVNDAFFPVMESGSCIVDVSSISAYLTPKVIMPMRHYPLSRIDKAKFMKTMMRRVAFFPAKVRSGVAYGISKNFVIWFARTDAARFGEKGVRVVSVSPGNFDTPMGELEKEEASTYIRHCAIRRLGKVDEIANLFAACVDERMGYLTGVDILCDGGCVASGCSPIKMK